MDCSGLLLRSADQVAAFREAHADYISRKSDGFVLWVRALPLNEWYNLSYDLTERNKEEVIGLLCLLYIDGHINITFDEKAVFIRRDPMDIEEWRRWRKKMDCRRKTERLK